jgi:hypothetical protein
VVGIVSLPLPRAQDEATAWLRPCSPAQCTFSIVGRRMIRPALLFSAVGAGCSQEMSRQRPSREAARHRSALQQAATKQGSGRAAGRGGPAGRPGGGPPGGREAGENSLCLGCSITFLLFCCSSDGAALLLAGRGGRPSHLHTPVACCSWLSLGRLKCGVFVSLFCHTQCGSHALLVVLMPGS